MLEESIIRTRQIARGLYPPGLEERGLVAVLEDLVDGLRQAGRTAIELQVETDLSGIAATQALQVFRIIQESIANSLRHSGSDRVTVRIASDRNFAVVTVRDYGCGLGGRPDQAASRGMGLNIMRCRAESIGAELVIETLDRGLCVSCRLALPEGEQHG
jgi:signal transduction histidine kinase